MSVFGCSGRGCRSGVPAEIDNDDDGTLAWSRGTTGSLDGVMTISPSSTSSIACLSCSVASSNVRFLFVDNALFLNEARSMSKIDQYCTLSIFSCRLDTSYRSSRSLAQPENLAEGEETNARSSVVRGGSETEKQSSVARSFLPLDSRLSSV